MVPIRHGTTHIHADPTDVSTRPTRTVLDTRTRVVQLLKEVSHIIIIWFFPPRHTAFLFDACVDDILDTH